MAFDGVVIANIVYDMNRLLTGNLSTTDFCWSKSSTYLFYYKDKGKSYDRPKLLYAASKIY